MDGPPWISLGSIAMKMLSIYWRGTGRTIFRVSSRQDQYPLTCCVVLYRCFVPPFPVTQTSLSPQRLQLNQPRRRPCEHPRSLYSSQFIIVLIMNQSLYLDRAPLRFNLLPYR